MRFRMIPIAAAASVALLAAGAQAAIVNGGFETGDFSGWTVVGSTDWTGVDASVARSGQYGAYFGEATPGNSISQTFSTVVGANYLVEFWLQLDDSAAPNAFSWSWNDVEQEGALEDAAGFSYTRFSKYLTATSESTTLSFNLLNAQSFFLLDDITVTAPASVSEPSGIALACAALFGLGVASRRRRGASN